MAVEIGTAYVSVVPSARGFGAALDKAIVPAAAAAGDSAGAEAGSAFGRRLTLSIAAAATAATAGLVALGKKGATIGLKTAAANEQAAISFTKFLGSTDKAMDMLNELKRFAADTPFEFPELQETSRMLLVAGIQADRVLPILRNLGDVVSSTGKGSEGMRRAAIALQQMAASGKIYAEDLNQLRDAGVPVFELLEGATGLAREELMDMIRAGKLGEKELNAVFDSLATGKGLERFVGVMELQSKTLLGLWSSLKDNLGQGLAEAMTPAVASIVKLMPTINEEMKKGMVTVGPVLAEATKELIELVAAIMPVLAPLFADVGSVLVEALAGGADIVKEFAGMLAFLARVLAQQVGRSVVELLPEFLGLLKVLSPLLVLGTRLAMILADLLAPALSAILRGAAPLVEVLVNGLVVVFGELQKLDLASIFERMAGLMVAVLDAAMPLTDVFIVFVRDALGILVGMAPDLLNAFFNLAVVMLPLLDTFAKLARDFAPILLSLLGEYLPVIIRMAEVLLPLWVSWQRMRGLWLDLWLRILMPFVPLLAHLAEVVLPLLERVLVPIVEAFAGFAARLGESKFGAILLFGAISALMALGLVAWLIKSMVGGMGLISMFTTLMFVIDVVKIMRAGEAIEGTGSAARTAGKYLLRLGDAAVIATGKQWLLTAATTAFNIVTSPWFLIPAVILAIAAAFVILYQDFEPFHQAVDALWDSFQRGIDWVKELVALLFAGDFTKAGEMVSEMGGKIVDTFANIGNLIKDKVIDWAGAIWEGLQGAAAAVARWFTDSLVPTIMGFLSGLGNVLKWLFTEAGPYLVVGAIRMIAALNIWFYTTVIPWLIRTGADMIVAFVGWIKEAAPAALSALWEWLQTIIPWITGTAIPWITERALALKDAFVAWVSEAWPALLAKLGEILSSIGGWVTGTAIPAVVGFVGPLVEAFLSWMRETGWKLVAGLMLWPVVIGALFYTKVLPLALELGGKLGGALLHFIQELPDRIIAGLTWAFETIPGWIATAAVWLAEKAAALGSALWAWITENAPLIGEKLGAIVDTIETWITDTAVPAIKDKAGALIGAITGWISDVVPKIPEKLGGILQAIGVWIAEEAIPTILSKAPSLLLAFLAFLIQLPWKIPMLLAKVLIAIVTWIAGAVVWLVPKIWELGKAFLSWAWRLPLFLIGALAKVLAVLLVWIWDTAWSLLEKAAALKDSLMGWIFDVIKAAPGKLAEFGTAIYNWLLDAENAVRDKAGKIGEAIINWIAETVTSAPGKLKELEEKILTFIGGLPKSIEDSAQGMFYGIANAFIAAINWVIRTWGKLKLEIPEIETPWGAKFGGFTIQGTKFDELPYISVESFAKGGRPSTGGPSLVGEQGPELFWPDRAGTIVPNDALMNGRSGLNIGSVTVTGQDRPTDTAFALRAELSWLSMVAAGT